MSILLKRLLDKLILLSEATVCGCSTYTHYQEDLGELKAVLVSKKGVNRK